MIQVVRTFSGGPERSGVPMLYIIGAISGVVALVLALILSLAFSRIANQLVKQDSEQIVQQLLDSIKPVAEAAVYASSEELAKMAIMPLIHSNHAVHIELRDDFEDVLIRYPESPLPQLGNEGYERVVLPLRYRNTNRQIGSLTVDIDYKPGKYIQNLSQVALVTIIASNIILGLVLMYTFWKRLLVPLQRLERDVEDSDRIAHGLQGHTLEGESSPSVEAALSSESIQRVLSSYRADYGSKELNEVASSFIRSLHGTLEATKAKDEAIENERREMSNRLALTQSIEVAISDAGIFMAYTPSMAHVQPEEIGAELDPRILKLVRTLFQDVDEFKQLLAQKYESVNLIEVDSGGAVPGGAEGAYSCEVRSEELGVWYLSRFGVYAGGRAIVCTDITARQKRAEELEQAKRLESLGVLTSGVAHEFNNILTIISSSLELEMMQSKDSQLLNNAHAATERGEKIVKQLLSTSRDPKKNARVVDVGTTLSELADSIRTSFGERHELTVDLLGDVYTKTEPELFEATITNLAVNARDALDNGGHIQIGMRIASDHEKQSLAGPRDPDADFVVVEVSDDGPGIDPKVQGRLFEPFFTTKAPGKGTGLGLSISYQFARNSGGQLVCSSALGKGTAFSLYLPMVARPASEAPVERVESSDKLDCSVLIVDDETMLAEHLSSYLESIDATVYVASGYEAAKEIVAKVGDSLDVVITDLSMPDYTGIDVVKLFTEPSSRPYCMIISGNVEQQAEFSSEERSLVDEWVQKPFRLRAMSEKVLNAVAQRSATLVDVAAGSRSRD